MEIYQNIQGWFTNEARDLYAEIVQGAEDGQILVEVGSWKGKSTAWMASNIKKSQKNLKFYCVDTWCGSLEHAKDSSIIKNTLYDEFLSNMRPLAGFFEPMRMTSIEASKLFSNQSIDFVYLDASHKYQDVKDDLNAWFPKIKLGGVIAGDDYIAGWPGVIKAVNEFFNERNMKFQVKGQTWFVSK